jgi:hypothetical protein
MEAVTISETLVIFYKTKQRNIPKDSYLQNCSSSLQITFYGLGTPELSNVVT